MKRYQFLILISIIFCFSPVVSEKLHSQTIKGSYLVQSDTQALRILSVIDSISEDSLRISELRGKFFNTAYDNKLADLIVIIDKRTPAKSQRINSFLTQNNKIRNELYGEQHFYVLFFVLEGIDANVQLNKCTTYFSKKNIQVSFASLKQTLESGEFALLSLIKMISQIALPEEKKVADTEDKQIAVTLDYVGKTGTCIVYYGIKKFAIAENSINRVTIFNVSHNNEKKNYSATFGNYSASLITTSIGVIGSSEKFKYAFTDSSRYDFMIFGHLYLPGTRPQRPRPHFNNFRKELWKQMSFSFTLGTRLSSDDFFKDIFVGCSIGHWVNNLGLVLGRNFRMDDRDDSKCLSRKPYWSFGLTYIL
ncbi:hypothetical protein JW964_20990 [candidate division KSB1 bacterium]|nr:hypothetical protein [candidate division KSB1 bacterium]